MHLDEHLSSVDSAQDVSGCLSWNHNIESQLEQKEDAFKMTVNQNSYRTNSAGRQSLTVRWQHFVNQEPVDSYRVAVP